MKFREDFSNLKELKNRFLFDYLTFNIKNVMPDDVLNLLCSLVGNSDVVPASFHYSHMGALTSYNRSYRFMSERFITINWREYIDPETGEVIECDSRQGVSVNITGTGCRFITEDDFYNLFLELKNYDVNYTRLDIAFDDFQQVMPVDDMVNSIESWTPSNKVVSTMAKYNNSRVYINRSGSGFSSKNFDLGSNGADRKLRMYDKKVEQNRDDVEYWKRLELMLRRKKAISFIDEFLLNKSIAICFVSYLSDFVRFLVGHKYGGRNTTSVETAPFWNDFLEQLKEYDFLKNVYFGNSLKGENEA